MLTIKKLNSKLKTSLNICTFLENLWTAYVCKQFELALKRRGETENSNNPETFHGLINLMSELNGVLKQHIEKTRNRDFLAL